jgi:hypothetical protein
MVMLLRESEPNGIVLINLYVVTFVTVMLLRDFGPYGGNILIVCCNFCHGNVVKGF